ncbi:hypothetical protein K505DRAFT_388011 [Melanomma pulvis-pyrius CBS 109.77]|uniref:Rhodopsin domain-containing protein n=1 Tax=Melanomma pulvis-pyrius CBS 109.77 TaxID=1314802 RepID=A0A6A6X7I4_9PLEO|nr:hypothetical protein K505DRAFT_388011 [Melanomma pulvis-pyrius CBS 109.77]
MAYRKPVATPVALGIIFPLLAGVAVLARFWSRRRKNMKWRMDDWILIPALLLCIANAIVMLVAATNGNLGRLMPLGPNGFPIVNPDFETFQKCIYANKIISTLSIAVTRYAILLFYNRIFIGHSFNISVWVLYVLNGAWGIAYTLLFVFSCIPISDTWKAAHGATNRHCVPLLPIKIYAIASILIDVSMLLIPWPQIVRLNISRREKVAVLAIFGLGALVLAVAIGKCIEFFSVISKISKDHQITFDEAPTMYWTIPETCMAVVCACLPTLRPLFQGWSPESLVGSMRSAISLHSVGRRSTGKPMNTQGSPEGFGSKQTPESVRNLTDCEDVELPALITATSYTSQHVTNTDERV